MVSHTRQMAETITEEVERQERSLAWLAKKSGITYPTLLSRMQGRSDFKTSEVLRVAAALELHPAHLFQQINTEPLAA